MNIYTSPSPPSLEGSSGKREKGSHPQKTAISAAEEGREEPSTWCILRTAPARTLPLAASLTAAGFEVWAPARTVRRIAQHGRTKGRKTDVVVPVLPTFAFARADQLTALLRVAAAPISPHPDFSIFSYAGRIPEIGDAAIAGLREEEAAAAAVYQAMRDEDTHDEAERIRIAAIQSAAARRRALKEMEAERRAGLRAQRRSLLAGAEVTLAEAPAFAGVTGVVVSSDGATAWVRFGNRAWKIETWRLIPSGVNAAPAT